MVNKLKYQLKATKERNHECLEATEEGNDKQSGMSNGLCFINSIIEISTSNQFSSD